MATDRRYKSSIPTHANERIAERYADGQKKNVKCFVNRKLVGTRYYDEEGYLSLERPYRDGKIHGVEYHWYFDGILTSAEPYKNGKPHGIARQWSQSGKLIGTYKMVNGTGIDLWWCSLNYNDEPPFYLSEACYLRDGLRHGYSLWIETNQKSVFVECFFSKGIRTASTANGITMVGSVGDFHSILFVGKRSTNDSTSTPLLQTQRCLHFERKRTNRRESSPKRSASIC